MSVNQSRCHLVCVHPNRDGPTPANGSSTHCARSPGFLFHQRTPTPTVIPDTPGLPPVIREPPQAPVPPARTAGLS